MEENMLISIKKTLILSLFALVSLGFLGCANIGHIVPVDNRIQLNEKKDNQGNFIDGDLTLNYDYSMTGKNLYLSGDASYRGGVDYLNIYVLFLDQTGTVLQQKIIYSSGYRVYQSWQADRKFQTNLVVPNGATALAFAYYSEPRSSRK